MRGEEAATMVYGCEGRFGSRRLGLADKKTTRDFDLHCLTSGCMTACDIFVLRLVQGAAQGSQMSGRPRSAWCSRHAPEKEIGGRKGENLLQVEGFEQPGIVVNELRHQAESNHEFNQFGGRHADAQEMRGADFQHHRDVLGL
jgi:hypothetical protein